MQEPVATAPSLERIIVKVGTNVLTRPDGRLDVTSISQLVDQIAELKRRGIAVILVSSGAVGAGRELLPAAEALNSVVQRQMLAAIGQIRLMELYRQFFAGHQLLCGQVLATKEDFRDRRHYLNMRNCLEGLLHDQVVPIVNENDVVSVTELMFTDNDELAGLVAAMLAADALVILSSVDGMYDRAPDDPAAQLIPEISADDDSVLDLVAPVRSSFGRGGMHTKLRMAQQTARLGTDVYLANGRRSEVLIALADGRFYGTRIAAQGRISTVKRWIAQQAEAKARITLNAGAVAALSSAERVSSLLPVGVIQIEGDFERGDLLLLIDEAQQPIGLGLAQYGSARARQYLGQQGHKPLVHYDYLYMQP